MTPTQLSSPPLYPRAVALITWLGVLLGFACLYLALRTVDFDLDAMTDPLNQLRRASLEKADLIEGAMLCDIFGFYLLMIPATLYLWHWLRERNPFVMAVATVCMLLYILTGALGGGILSVLWPSLIRDHVQAARTRRGCRSSPSSSSWSPSWSTPACGGGWSTCWWASGAPVSAR
ncbi:hypothetical protein [Ideonella oryzae]|uniref:Uncharacterized protein n=1 Tax=Ideonella oryzae TaxID=2937441 RepID=A0ABT1BH59_9BURK|nr:hypothetical protein [Ideonella oryzae]MCO5975555.1 hypothetical protein [Ideonella oryzae]